MFSGMTSSLEEALPHGFVAYNSNFLDLMAHATQLGTEKVTLSAGRCMHNKR